jgi:3-hydroxyacyl-CoA dehydrogenase/enoyl-CoA hydratase/3-hydroxybutyryl-CoA epimerase
VKFATLTITRAAVPVVLKAMGAEALTRTQVEREVDAWMGKESLGPGERDRALGRLTWSSGGAAFGDCELVLEALGEQLGHKRQLLSELDNAGQTQVVFATTTCAWSVHRVAEASRAPERVIGLHYGWLPGDGRLLEVVTHQQTSRAALQTCLKLAERQGQRVILVRDVPGGYAPRLLASLVLESLYLLTEGVAPIALEEALGKWGFADSPLELVDRYGPLHWTSLVDEFARTLGPRWSPPPILARLARFTRLRRPGRDAGYGQPAEGRVRRWLGDAWLTLLGTKPASKLRFSEIAQRCALRVVDEAARCFDEGIVQSARDGDLGAVHGAGFPAFRGGPFRYVDEVGAAEIVRRLERLARERYRFQPAALLLRMARGEGTFHGRGALPPGHGGPWSHAVSGL